MGRLKESQSLGRAFETPMPRLIVDALGIAGRKGQIEVVTVRVLHQPGKGCGGFETLAEVGAGATAIANV